jgi:integrase
MKKEELSPSRIPQAPRRTSLDPQGRSSKRLRSAQRRAGSRPATAWFSRGLSSSNPTWSTQSDAVAAPYRTLVAVLGLGGLRFSEGAALRRRDVDGLRRRLIVEESLPEVSITS